MSDHIPIPPPHNSSLIVGRTDVKTTPLSNGKKKSGGVGKPFVIISIILLLLTIPVAVYYVSKQQTQLTEQRGQATGGDHCDENYYGVGEPVGEDCPEGQCCLTIQINSSNGKHNRKCLPCGGQETNPVVYVAPTAVPTEIPTVAPTNEPQTNASCDASCDSDDNCASGLVCATVDGVKRCRNASCPAVYTCSCPAPTSAPIAADPMPTSGSVHPTIILGGVGAGILLLGLLTIL